MQENSIGFERLNFMYSSFYTTPYVFHTFCTYLFFCWNAILILWYDFGWSCSDSDTYMMCVCDFIEEFHPD